MILCEHGPGGRPALFDGAADLAIAWEGREVAPALRRLDAARAEGAWVAGYVAYEAGYALEPRLAPLMPQDRAGPLLAFGVYAGPRAAGGLKGEDLKAGGPKEGAGETVRLAPLRPLVARDAYGVAFARVRDYIAAGDCYQANLTFPLETRLVTGTPLGLWRALRALQPVGFGAYADFGVGPVVVSRSPELFFRLDAQGRIEARPMKGTAPRDPDPARDAALAARLEASAKDRAENLMIVDLLRNDIARIARLGSVRVPEIFTVESFATVHQMSSRVVGDLARPVGLAGLMAALFPCGSVTGAPKIRAMEIIREVEPHPRGIYCGTFGWMAPDGSAAFSVAIRTLCVEDGRVTLNVGGGVVEDSTAEGEWEEALWKARYVGALTIPA